VKLNIDKGGIITTTPRLWMNGDPSQVKTTNPGGTKKIVGQNRLHVILRREYKVF